MKTGRVVGIDDGFFMRGKNRHAPLVATIFKGSIIEGFRFGRITVDGTDVNDVIKTILTPYREQLSAIFLYGTIFGGTNVVDVDDLYHWSNKPVICVLDEKPDDRLVRLSIERYGTEVSLDRLISNPSVNTIITARGIVYASWLGASEGEVRRLIEMYQISGKIPEPLRISHLLGREVGKWISQG